MSREVDLTKVINFKGKDYLIIIIQMIEPDEILITGMELAKWKKKYTVDVKDLDEIL